MKKIRNTVIIVGAAVLAVVAAVLLLHGTSRTVQPAPTDASQQAVMDEYIIEASNEKAPARANAVWLTEGVDGNFNENDSEFSRTLSVLEQSIFDEVYINIPLKLEDEDFEQRLGFAVSSVRNLDKKAYAALDIALGAEKITALSRIADGVVLTGTQNLTASEINKVTDEIKQDIPELIVCIGDGFEDFSELSAQVLHITAYDEKDVSRLIGIKEKEIVCCLALSGVDGKDVLPDLPLRNIYALKEAAEVSTVCFDSFKATRENIFNCFGAVKTYLTEGIAPEIAFRQISVYGYTGETVTEKGYTAAINISGSYLFPFFIDGRSIGSSANGNICASVDLKPGENSFALSQNSSSLDYKVKSSCESDIVTFVSPEKSVSLLPGESFKIIVIAHCNAEVYVRMGKEEIRGVREYGATGFTAFTSVITAPKSEEEIKSLGKLTVVAFYGDKSFQYDGPQIILAGSSAPSQPQTTLPAGNYTPTVQNSVPTPSNPSTGQNISYTGNLMCVVKEPYADAKLIALGDDYAPFCSPLAGGTMDYVVAESTGYNSDDDEPEYYYDLASGMRVRRENVDLVTATGFGDNTLNVNSSVSGHGKLQITLDNDWKVPYNITYPGQNYYSSYTKKYNVTSFNASEVHITFYHTVSASGQIDISGSDVVSSASWSVSKQDKTATLVLKLKNPGEYYGCSLEYDSQGNTVITLNRKPQSSEGYVVLLDPGHGGAEPGAVGLDSVVQEREINLIFAYYVKAELEKRGVTVYMTRTGNDREKDTLTLEQRKQMTRALKPDIYVSIHCNGSYNPESIGTSTYYYEPFSYKLAKNIYDELLGVHKNTLYAGRQELYSQLADNVQFYPFSVTRVEDCPSTLVEVGYLTNDYECALLAQPENQERFGKAIADGIYKTLTQ